MVKQSDNQGSVLPQELRDLIRGGKCVAFIGSGPSVDTFGSWTKLINKLCKKCGSSKRVKPNSLTGAYLIAAQDAKNRNKTAYYKFLGEHFGNLRNRNDLDYPVLLALNFRCYLTINFDRLLAEHARTARLKVKFPTKAYGGLSRIYMKSRTIQYLHGLILEGQTPQEGAIVLSKDEFAEAYAPNSDLMNLLVPTFTEDAIVFIGCRLREPSMPSVFSVCMEQRQKREKRAKEQGNSAEPPPRFILLAKPTAIIKGGTGDAQKKGSTEEQMAEDDGYYRQLGISTVWYDAPGGDHSILRKALEKLAKLPDITPNFGYGGDS